MSMIKLGVNIDHVATLRQARGTRYPDPIAAADAAERGGADGITIHLREDRRHIQDRDLAVLTDTVQTKINLEMAVTPEMVEKACRFKPEDCCLVPEKREELTTEGGLDVAGNLESVREATAKLHDAGVRVSLFIDPDPAQIAASLEAGAKIVELHTGTYADAPSRHAREAELERIKTGAQFALAQGVTVNAGHGLHFHNVQEVAAIPGMNELNIGHALIARALFDGLENAVREMKRLIREAAAMGSGRFD